MSLPQSREDHARLIITSVLDGAAMVFTGVVAYFGFGLPAGISTLAALAAALMNAANRTRKR